MGRGRVENLKTRQLTRDEAQAMNKKSIAQRRKNKEQRAMGQMLAREILGQDIPDTAMWLPLRTMLEQAGYDISDVSFEKAMHIVQMVNALKEGDVKAYTALLKVAGLMEERHDVNLHEDITITFGE